MIEELKIDVIHGGNGPATLASPAPTCLDSPWQSLLNVDRPLRSQHVVMNRWDPSCRILTPSSREPQPNPSVSPWIDASSAWWLWSSKVREFCCLGRETMLMVAILKGAVPSAPLLLTDVKKQFLAT